MVRSLSALERLELDDEETGDLVAVVETPKGSHNKYKYDTKRGVMQLGGVLGEGLAFPYDFGFFPSTLGEDGDPLDVLLMLDSSVPPATIVTVRLIGVLECRQKEKGKPWVRNDRYLAVATHAHTHQHLQRLSDFHPHLLREIEAFFVHYTGLNGKRLKVVGRGGPRQAARGFDEGRKAFRKSA